MLPKKKRRRKASQVPEIGNGAASGALLGPPHSLRDASSSPGSEIVNGAASGALLGPPHSLTGVFRGLGVSLSSDSEGEPPVGTGDQNPTRTPFAVGSWSRETTDVGDEPIGPMALNPEGEHPTRAGDTAPAGGPKAGEPGGLIAKLLQAKDEVEDEADSAAGSASGEPVAQGSMESDLEESGDLESQLRKVLTAAASGEKPPETVQERFLANAGMSHVDCHLEGHDLVGIYDDTNQERLGAPGSPGEASWQVHCDAVCRFFSGRCRALQKLLLDLLDESQEWQPLFMRSVGPSFSSRPETSNWKRPKSGWQDVKVARRDELSSLLVKHFGEARSWRSEDSWLPVAHAEAEEWRNRVQVAASGASSSETDSWFSPFDDCHASGARPDLARPLSTLVCPQKDDPDAVCLRIVKAVTLADVLYYYRDDFMLQTLYAAWQAGRLVVRARPGTASIPPPHIPSTPSSQSYTSISN